MTFSNWDQNAPKDYLIPHCFPLAALVSLCILRSMAQNFDSTLPMIIVDDMATQRSYLKKNLEKMGVKEIDECDNGEAALSKLKSALQEGKKYSVIICDWSMPGMSGLEVLKRVKKDPALKDIPFLMVTAENEAGTIQEAYREGVSGYLPKPFSGQMLAQKILEIYENLP